MAVAIVGQQPRQQPRVQRRSRRSSSREPAPRPGAKTTVTNNATAGRSSGLNPTRGPCVGLANKGQIECDWARQDPSDDDELLHHQSNRFPSATRVMRRRHSPWYSPQRIGPAEAVPQAARHHRDRQIHVGGIFDFAPDQAARNKRNRAAKWKRDVPAPPEIIGLRRMLIEILRGH